MRWECNPLVVAIAFVREKRYGPSVTLQSHRNFIHTTRKMMPDEKKVVYAKFKIKDGVDIFHDMIVSEDKDRIDLWIGSAVKKSAVSSSEHLTEKNSGEFYKVAKNFESTIRVFQKTMPFIMTTLPIMMNFDDDQKIREFCRDNGKVLQTGEFELYALEIPYWAELEKRISDATSIAAGVSRLPDFFLIGLVSAYDTFLSNLIRAVFLTKPEIVSGSDKNISFKDLVNMGSIDAARDRIIDKEIEAIIRESHSKHIKWLEDRLGLPPTKDLAIWSEFIEICERRNLLVHNGGVASIQYMEVCREHKCNIAPDVLGTRLRVDAKYYKRAVEVFLEFGMKLTQVIWRKLMPTQIELAAAELDHFAYRLILQRSYNAAANILKFGLYEMKKQGTDAIRKQIIVNYANAVKLGGNLEEAIEILDNEDWSATTDKYKICVAAIKGELKVVKSLMRKVVDMNLMQIEAFQTWPVFEGARADQDFVEAFEKGFGIKITEDREKYKSSMEYKEGDDVEIVDNASLVDAVVNSTMPLHQQ